MIRVVHLRDPSDYRQVHRLQKALVEAVACGELSDVILLLEHQPTITVGRARGAMANVLLAGEWPVVEVERGGDVTLHLPGQLVAYPILKLVGKNRDLHRHLRFLERSVMSLLSELGQQGGRDERNTGVWLEEEQGPAKKVCSIGIACRRWVTYHGLALNVDVDLSAFNRINPCGFTSSVMTRLADHLQGAHTVHELAPRLAVHLATELGRDLEFVQLKGVEEAAELLLK